MTHEEFDVTRARCDGCDGMDEYDETLEDEAEAKAAMPRITIAPPKVTREEFEQVFPQSKEIYEKMKERWKAARERISHMRDDEKDGIEKAVLMDYVLDIELLLKQIKMAIEAVDGFSALNKRAMNLLIDMQKECEANAALMQTILDKAERDMKILYKNDDICEICEFASEDMRDETTPCYKCIYSMMAPSSENNFRWARGC